MSKVLKIGIILFLILICQSIAFAQNIVDSAKVVRIIDGDTIVVSIDGVIRKVRLIGIDTPETKHPEKPVEYFGKEATAYTTKHLKDRIVYLTYDWQRQDRYKRLLAYIWLDKNRTKLFNLQILLDGYAFAYFKYPFDQKLMRKFRHAEDYARVKRLGLWKNL